MNLIKLLKLRIARGFNLRTLGPNEARIYFDAVVAFAALLVAWLFAAVFIHKIVPGVATVALSVAIPVLFLVSCFAIGVYSRLRTAQGRTKALALGLAVLIASGLGLAVGIVADVVALWALLTAGPVTLARLLLNLPYIRNRSLAIVAVTLRGPVLVIGGAGYIGSHTVNLLLNSGRRVRVLDKLMYTGDSLADFRENPDFEFIEGDATDIRKLTAAMRGASSVVHLAGLVGDPACAVDPEFTRHTNIVATRMAKDVAQALGIQRFVFASSCSVYGVSDIEVDETADLNPVSLYAQTKIDSEQELLASGRDDFYVTVLRFATVFGHSRRPRFDLVGNLFTAQAVTDGLITVIGPHQWRPFIHVRDLARAIIAVLDADPLLVQGQIFNVGDSRLNMTILQLAEAVRAVVGKSRHVQISVKDDIHDKRNYAVSFHKIREALNYHAQTLIEDGISEMAENFNLNKYHNYRDEIYSNLAMTRRAVDAPVDPVEMMHIYAPLRMS